MKKENFYGLKCILIPSFVFLIQFSLSAETVILRNHDVLHGKITNQDANILRMNDDSGKSVEIKKNDILKVSYRDVKDVKEIKKIIDDEERKLPPEKRKKVTKTEQRSRYSILWRSALVPGWGQWKAGKTVYAGLSLFTVTFFAGYAYQQRVAALSAEDKYNNQTKPIGISTLLSLATANSSKPFVNPFAFGLTGAGAILGPAILGDRLYKPYGEAISTYNRSLQFIGLAYGIQLIHSFFIGRSWEKESPNTSIGKRAAFGDWNVNAYPRQAFTVSGSVKESYYELNYAFQF